MDYYHARVLCPCTDYCVRIDQGIPLAQQTAADVSELSVGRLGEEDGEAADWLAGGMERELIG